MTMLEKVARAICVASGLDPDRKFKSSNWDEETAPHELAWHEFQPSARAAIEAMQEPTEAMYFAGLTTYTKLGDPCRPIALRAAFAAQIKAALAEDVKT